MKLNDPIIKAAKPREKTYKLTDGKALVLLVNPNGTKWWRFRYRFNGREKMLGLGVYPEVSLREARERHQDARNLLKQGIDPSAQRKKEKMAKDFAIKNTFEAVARAWWEVWHVGKTERHAIATMRSLERNLFPVMGDRSISYISALDIIDALKPIEARSSDTARRLLDTCRMIFRFAVAHGRAQRNPANDFAFGDVFKTEPQENYARIDRRELPALLHKIDTYQGRAITKLALQFMLLTFVRTRELTEAEWSEIDWDARLWRIPAARMKKRTEHLVPLSTQGLELLEKLRSLTSNSRYIFPGQLDQSKPMHFNTLLSALYSLGYKGQMTGHGFRGLAATILREKQYPSDHVQIQLAHLTGDAVKRAYDAALHLPERTDMMQAWADYLDQMRTIGTT